MSYGIVKTFEWFSLQAKISDIKYGMDIVPFMDLNPHETVL